MQKNRISQKEIARLANVCQAAVSAVLNPNNRGNTKVGAEARERILQIAAEHNYRPNLQARILRGDGRSNLIGILINPQISQFFYDLLLPLEGALRTRHKRMIIGQLGNDVVESELVLQSFIDYNLDGVLVLHHDICERERLFRTYLPLLPTAVFLDPPIGVTGGRIVSVDYSCGVREAVEHLAAAGRQRIALCMNDALFLSMRQRLAGYRQGMLLIDRKPEESLLFIKAPESESESAFAELIAEAVEQLIVRNRADAVICGNDEWALAMLKELNRRGIAVPDEVALVGYGNVHNICRATSPELTSIHHGMEELAGKLVAALTDPEAGREPVHSKLVIRQSTITPNGKERGGRIVC